MISVSIPAGPYPGLAYDGTATFAGVLQSFFSVKDITGQNTGISRRWNDNTATQYLRDYTERILPVISRLYGPQKPMHEFLESHFEEILSELKAQHHYSASTMMHYRHLLWSAYSMGVSKELYADHIYWDIIEDDDDPEKREQNRAHSLTRIRKSLSIEEDIRMLMWICSLDPVTATGEEIGIALMYLLGIRDNEACGATYSSIRMMANHPDMAVFTISNTTKINSATLKPSGKTENAPRELPLLKYAYQCLLIRRTFLEDEVKAGRLVLPPNIESVDLLPIVCKGLNFTTRAGTYDLSKAGRSLLMKVGISKSQFAELHRILLSTDFQDNVISEKNPTLYLVRRNTVTRQYNIGFAWEEIQYWIGHNIEDSLLQRNFFSDEETLYEIGKKYEKHPLFQLLTHMTQENATSPSKMYEDSFTYCLDAQHAHIIDVEANEPNQGVFITAKSKSAFSVVQTEIETDVPPGSLVSITHTLQAAYWATFQRMQPGQNE